MNFCLITAGGSGKRMKSSTKKQFMKINGQEVLSLTLSRFLNHPAIDHVIVVVPAEELNRQKEIFAPNNKITVIAGGAERQDSVFNGLKKVSRIIESNGYDSQSSLCLIHDGVRPFVTSCMITGLIETAKKQGAAIPVLLLTETLMRKDDKRVTYVDRHQMFSIQTPQTFIFETIFKAFETAYSQKKYYTDESSMIVEQGGTFAVVEGERLNIKITTPADFTFANNIYEMFEKNYV